MARIVPVLVAVVALVSATPSAAMADRSGDGPVYASRLVHSFHMEFTLPGSGWRQYVGALGGWPVAGRYAVDLPVSEGAPCRVDAIVHSRAQHSDVRVGRHIVRISPNTQAPLRYRRTGQHSGVRWWTGTTVGEDAAAIAVQRTPVKLRATTHRWLVTRVSVTHSSVRSDETSCRQRARSIGARTVLRIVRTVRPAAGRAVTEGPFIGP